MSLQVIESTAPKGARLGIKSSLPKFKEGFAILLLLKMAFKEEASIVPAIEHQSNLKFDPQVKDTLLNFLANNGISDQQLLDQVGTKLDACSLLEAQMEHLQVGYELFLSVVGITFPDGKSSAVERKGGKRYEKLYKFSSAMTGLADLVTATGVRGLNTLLHWVLDSNASQVTPDVEVEKMLKRRFLHLSAKTLYQINRVDDTSRIFNTIGMYSEVIALAKKDETLDLSGKEARGTLRILKNVLNARLLPGLAIHNNQVSLDTTEFSLAEIETLVKEVVVFDEITNISSVVGNGGKGNSKGTVNNSAIGSRNIIFYGVPGTGKSYLIDNEYLQPSDHVKRVVFHPDYMHANFVGQILPTVEDGTVTYSFVPGPFTSILREAYENPDEDYVLVIEEINRGNASAIFGDIFQLLDRDSTGKSTYSISNREISLYIYGSPKTPIYIPSNLRLYATMNTSDQNVFTLDTAFQRRWTMRLVPNNLEAPPFADTPILDTSVTWKNFASFVNTTIITANSGVSSSEDKRLGAFFVTESDLTGTQYDDARIFAEKVIKYLWDDAFKFSRDSFFESADIKTLEDVIRDFCSANGNDRWTKILIPDVSKMLVPNSVAIGTNSDANTSGTIPEPDNDNEPVS